MPIDYRVLPINLINNYVWDLASGNVEGVEAISSEVWDTDSYTHPPFFPVHENQGADTKGIKAFIIYDYLFEQSKGAMWEMKCEKAIYTIVSHNPGHVYAIKNFLQDNLNKIDQTAQSINKHINDDSIRFKFVKCSQDLFMMQELKQTERSFAPRFASTLTISYDYTRS
jgi:hypothetical protein